MTALDDRFWRKVMIGEWHECWEWNGCRVRGGYGMFSVGGTNKYAHRVAYGLVIEDPGDLRVLHRCDNPACCNPGHLFIGTQLDNVRDMISKGRKRPAVGERNGNSKLSGSDVEEIRRRRESGESQADIARDFGVIQCHVSRICRGKNWSHT